MAADSAERELDGLPRAPRSARPGVSAEFAAALLHVPEPPAPAEPAAPVLPAVSPEFTAALQPSALPTPVAEVVLPPDVPAIADPLPTAATLPTPAEPEPPAPAVVTAPPVAAPATAVPLTTVRYEKAGAPPWMWLITAMGLNPIGILISAGMFLYSSFSGVGNFAHHASFLQWLTFLAIFLPLLAFSGLIPLTALFFGSLSIFIPTRRQRELETQYGLTPLDLSLPVCQEIEQFIHGQYPQVTLTANLLRTSLLAFVYPDGASTVRLAIFGGLLKLWASDRGAAQAVLLHELAHFRRGDALHIGAGSGLVRALQISAASLAGGLLLWVLMRALSVQLFTLAVTGAVQSFSLYILIIAAVWAAEFSADRLAADDFGPGGEDALERALRLSEDRETGWRGWAARLTHPPLALRLRMLRRTGWSGLFAACLAFPLGMLAASLLGWTAAWLGRILTGPIPLEHMQLIPEDRFTQQLMLDNKAYLIAVMGLIMWPAMHLRYAAIWSKQKVARVRGPVGVYFAASVVCFVLFIGAILMSSATDEFALGIKGFTPPPKIDIDWDKINKEINLSGPQGNLPPSDYNPLNSGSSGDSSDSSSSTNGGGSDSSSDPYQYSAR